MQIGFLGLVTNPKFPDRLRIVTWEKLPEKIDNKFEKNIRYITKFNDILAAKLQLHNALRHSLLDANYDLYQTTLEKAISAIESNKDLKQERIWIDSTLNKKTIATLTIRRKQQQRRIDIIIQLVGILAIVLLIINFFSSFQ